jgi:hypothetical protein
MVDFLRRVGSWWQERFAGRRRYHNYYYKPDRVFKSKKGNLEIAARIIGRPLPSRWMKYVMSSFVIIMKANWLIVEGKEINEFSNHPLTDELKKLNPPSTKDLRKLRFLGFSIYEDSVWIEPLLGGSMEEVWKLVGDFAEVLFEWELLREKVAPMLIENE